MKRLKNFDVHRRVTIVDWEKSTDSACRAIMPHAQLFVLKQLVEKNMVHVVGSEKAKTLSLYE